MGARTKVAKVTCNTADEAANIQRALDKPEVCSFLGIIGALESLGGPERTQVLEFVRDMTNVQAGRVRIETRNGEHNAEIEAEVPRARD